MLLHTGFFLFLVMWLGFGFGYMLLVLFVFLKGVKGCGGRKNGETEEIYTRATGRYSER